MQSQTESEVDSYLHNLLKMHPQSTKIGQALQQPISKYQSEICNGRYNIEANPEKPEVTIIKPEMTQQQHEVFLKRLKEEKERVRAMRKHRISMEKEKEKQEKDQLMKKDEEEKKEKQHNKKKQLEDRINILNATRLKRNSQSEASNKVLLAVKNSETLHQKLLKNFLFSETSSLEDKKKKLAEIRALHKPLSKDEFLQHNQKIQQLKLKVTEQRSLLKDKRSASVTDIYKSQWYQKAKQLDPAQQHNEKQELQAKKAKEKRQKLRKYGDYVKSNFKPEIDEKKSELLKQMIANNTHHALDIKGDEGRTMGLQYLKYSKEHIASTRSENRTNTNITSLSQPKPVNYIDEIRRHRLATEQQRGSVVDSMLKQVDDKQRVEVVKGQVQKLEQQTKRKEKLSKVNPKVVNEQLDQLYVNTIKAKLSLLK